MFKIKKLDKTIWPNGLFHIPVPPKNLSVRGLKNFQRLVNEDYKFLTIVGSRNFTDYGERVCQKIIPEIANHKICLVSGMAYGIDSIIHRLAIDNQMATIAFPGSGLDDNVLYPKGNISLAYEILESGGSLISEFEDFQEARSWMFPQRNRLMVGISHSVLIIEAARKSGSGISANMAVDYNKNLMAIPGSIFNHNSEMTNELISKGAFPVVCGQDILRIMNFEIVEETELLDEKRKAGDIDQKLNTIEESILNFIQNGMNDKEEILTKMKIPISEFNRAITKLEIAGLL